MRPKSRAGTDEPVNGTCFFTAPKTYEMVWWRGLHHHSKKSHDNNDAAWAPVDTDTSTAFSRRAVETKKNVSHKYASSVL